MSFLSIYCSYLKTFFKAKIEYRFGFWFGILSNMYSYFTTYALFGVITNTFGSIGGWDFSDMTLLYSISLFTYSISGMLLWCAVYHLGETITRGNLDILLTRPMGVLPQLMLQNFGDTFIGQTLVTLAFFLYYLSQNANELSLLKILFLIISTISGILIQSGSMITIGSISFWTYRSEELGGILYYDLRDLTKYPITIYPKFIRFMLTFILPWAFINYYPAALVLGKLGSSFELGLSLISPLVGIFVLTLSLKVFKCGLLRYEGVGA